MIRNILFDLDDTLFDFRQAEKIALSKTLLHIGIEPKAEMLARYSDINLAQWKLLEQGKLTLEEVKVRRYQLFFDEIGIAYSAKHATEYYENLLGTGHYFVDGAETLLTTLSGSYRLYLVTNGSTAVQKRRIESAGISKYLNDVFISQEIGFDKPHPEFFDYCFSKIPQFKKQETLIVGDSLSSDIKGGKDSGITTVWFTADTSEKSSEIIPNYEIHKLLDLIPLLETI